MGIQRICPTLQSRRTAPSVARRYGAEQGQGPVREAIASTFYPGLRAADEIFVSDGSKCDIARLQVNRPVIS